MGSSAALMMMVVVVMGMVVISSCRAEQVGGREVEGDGQGIWVSGGGGEEKEVVVGGGEGGPQPDPPATWCDPIPLPTDSFFLVSQSLWWMQYYSFQYSTDRKLTFKVYPTVYSVDMFVGLYTREADCPQPASGYYNHFSWHINAPTSLKVDYHADTLLMLYVRVIGGNYTIMGCDDDTCVEYCPNDCSGRGFCNVTSPSATGGGGTCVCAPHAAGDDCRNSTVPHHHKKTPPFGSWTIFYTVVGGIALVAILIGGLVGYRFISRKDQSRMYTKIGPLEEDRSINSSIRTMASETDLQSHRVV